MYMAYGQRLGGLNRLLIGGLSLFFLGGLNCELKMYNVLMGTIWDLGKSCLIGEVVLRVGWSLTEVLLIRNFFGVIFGDA